MSLLLINLLLAMAWVAMTGSISVLNFFFGFGLGVLALWLIREQIGTGSYVSRVYRIVSLALLFFYELVLSAIQVARVVLSPRMQLKPSIVAYELQVDRDFEITLLANLITLTPGTLSVDVSDDRKFLFVHAIDGADAEALKTDIAQGFERKIMEAFR